MSDKKNICIITGNALPVPAVQGGAVETLLTNLMEENERKQKAHFTVFSKEDPKAKEAAKKYAHTSVIYVPEDTKFDKINNRIRRYLTQWICPGAWLDGGYYRKIYGMMLDMEKRGERIDAIVCEGGLLHEFRVFAKHWGREKLYVHVHHHLPAEKSFDGIFGHMIAVSEFAKSEWMRTTAYPDTDATVVYNCVDEEKFNRRISEERREELRRTLGIAPEDFCVLYCGRMQEVKGVRELLQAFARITLPNIKLLMIGNADFGTDSLTPFLREVRELVEQDKERIKFTGYIDHGELYQYYQCANLQIVPSMWEEAAGLVAIEGMLSGLPLIVTKSGGLIEYAPETVAKWVDRGQIVDQLVQAMEDCYSNPEELQEMKKKSVEYSRKFRKEVYYDSYLNCMKEGENVV